MYAPSLWGIVAMIGVFLLIPVTAALISWCLGWIAQGMVDAAKTRRP